MNKGYIPRGRRDFWSYAQEYPELTDIAFRKVWNELGENYEERERNER